MHSMFTTNIYQKWGLHFLSCNSLGFGLNRWMLWHFPRGVSLETRDFKWVTEA